jgi:hypothetical protein
MATSGAFDEIWGHGGPEAPRAEFAALSQWVAETPASELQRRQQSAEAAFRQLGITFAVYGDSDAAERIIPFDIVPRVFLAERMDAAVRGAGPARRGDQRLPRGHLRRAPNPQGRADPARADLSATSSSAPRSPASARRTAVWAHICGIDLVRTGPTNSTCWRTMRARPRACRTCWRIARRCCGCAPSCSAISASPRSIPIPTCCSRRCSRSRRATIRSRCASC